MNIYAGSFNVSRIPGQYVYPAPKYNTAPIEEVSAVQSQKEHHISSIEDLKEMHERSRIETKFSAKSTSNAFNKLQPYQNYDNTQKGLFLNILG